MSLLRRVVLLLGGVAALAAPASALEIPVAEPDTREWTALVMETEALLALQVPEQVLHDMQYRIFRWQQEAAAIQQAATLQVEQLQSRLSLFDDSQATESIAGDEIESLRQRITGNLNDAMTSLLLAEDIAQHATTLLRAIEDDLASRRSDRLLSLAASPLYPPAWLAAIGFLGTFAEDVISEITEGVGAVDLRDWSLNRLPVVLTALLFGILLLTLARHWTLRSFDGIRVRLSMPDAGAISNLSRLIADVVLPVIGVSLLVQSVQATGFPGLYASMLIAAIPWMAGTLYGVRWLNSVLFATADERAFSLGTSQSDQQDRDDQNRIDHEEPVQGPDHQGVAPIVLPLGWIAALEQLVRPLTNHGASTPIVETVVYYPFIIIAAYLLLRLGRRLVHHTESADREGNQVGRRILHGLARASLIVAVLSMILATIGLIPATRLMVFATINTFAV
ncbi:MAG: hypothetical protein OXC91_10590, partial [Rhodobacteraceae bacterium]|nr:hypothetical protein [Paracoccaceae bacterium]